MKGTITKRSIDALQAPAKGEVVLWDSALKGFGLRVRPSGEKTFITCYRPNGGGRGQPYRKFVIGGYGSPWTPEQARKKAEAVLLEVRNGGDPAAVKRELRSAETVADLAERFLSDHVEAKRKSRTAAEYKRLIYKNILPEIGSVPIHQLSPKQVDRLHQRMKGTPYQANRVLAVLGSMLTKAEGWGLRPLNTNPCARIERFPEKARERMLSASELAALSVAIDEYPSPIVRAALKLLVFSGARLREILTLKWTMVNFERGEARLQDSKTGQKTIHLPPPAIAILSELPREAGNPYVLPGQKANSHLVNLEKPWRAIRAKAGLDDVRLHDLRHCFASIAASSGMALPIIGKLLGHTQSATTQRYAHISADPLKLAAANIAERIEKAMSIEK
ncbi:tyrosine-type recombinase/integrase [Acidiphilium multivorum]|uniref:tyrosine-type recombinase/integrase n=1 Tax=Acidiphilium multivorum TaxID=62140 RepID=UPI001F4BDA68|nr:site-specific integrase [Acidiphilium multivorum]UNC14751.1 tyrosine-type recombinase/integrase [Acidiphilium multivorum]